MSRKSFLVRTQAQIEQDRRVTQSQQNAHVIAWYRQALMDTRMDHYLRNGGTSE